MVNETSFNQNKIIEQLYHSRGTPVSGDVIGQSLGISRVAVWKQIKALIENGYEIESSSRGYSLSNPDDQLFSCCFPEKYRSAIHYYPVVETTMDTARYLAREPGTHMNVVVAEYQTRGRGRLNRQWISSKGGLWFTLILIPDLPPAMSYIFNFAASVCLAKTLKQIFNIDVSVKWPNDLLINDRKLCGLLSEMETRADMVRFLNIGIGLNVNNTPGEFEPRAISIRDVLNRSVSRRDILTTFLNQFETRTRDINIPEIINEYKQHTSTIGRRVSIETFGRIHEGLATDVDESGALIILTHKGSYEKIIYGDCFYQEHKNKT